MIQTFFMFITNKRVKLPSEIEVDCNLVKTVDNFKLIGINLDNKLNFSTHCSNLKRIINRKTKRDSFMFETFSSPFRLKTFMIVQICPPYSITVQYKTLVLFANFCENSIFQKFYSTWLWLLSFSYHLLSFIYFSNP